MRTQVIQLETHDDLSSACEKMNWGKMARVLLVWPVRGEILDRRLDLVLLQRHSRELGLQLGVVPRSPGVRWVARQIGIPVFRSLKAAEKGGWRIRTRKPAGEHPLRKAQDLRSLRPVRFPVRKNFVNKPVVRAVLFTLAVFAVLGLMAFLITVQ